MAPDSPSQPSADMSAPIGAWREPMRSAFPANDDESLRRNARSAAASAPALLLAALLTLPTALTAGETESRFFESAVRPILTERCITCHSTEKQKGDLDLEQFASMERVKRDPSVWERTLEQLADNEMPPKGKPQLSTEQKATLTKWAQSTLEEIALASAGDPGPVALRRLSNMEYAYTVRDLTGVESLDPAREFPVDGAAGEGFTNAGAALVMSPALLTKYLDAAKEIAKHAVLTPDGIRFSAYTTGRDWTDEALARIRGFYARYTASGAETQTTQQGVKLDIGTGGGRLPLERYLAALQGRGSEEGLSPKYLGILRAALTDSKPSLVLDPLRARFKAGTLTAADVAPWQQALWRFSTVGHIGKQNGPRAWQEAVTPLVAQQEMRVKLTGEADVTLYLVARDAGDGEDNDDVVWVNPRLIAAGRPDTPITNVPAAARHLEEQGARVRSSGAGSPCIEAKAPSILEVQIPAASAKGAEFVVTGRLAASGEGSVQMQALTAKPETLAGLAAGKLESFDAKGQWSDNNRRTRSSVPVIVNDGSQARRRFEAAFEEFRALFPIALCYTKIVPVDEVVTLTLLYREDDQLKRLLLSDAESNELDALWRELLFVSEAPLKQVDAFEQLWQFATQDAKPDAFEPMREPIRRAAEAFRTSVVEAEPRQVQAALDFAERAWRRPLSEAEKTALREFYRTLRGQELSHPAAVRMLLARALVAPAFLYRGEKPAPGAKAAPVNDWEMATRLSYFLWASAPDEELCALAASGRLHEPDALAAQARRMMRNPRIRRLALEFGCQWLHVRDVATLDEKSERHFPTFLSVRESMQEEVARFFIDLFQNDRSVLSLLDADHTFLDGTLAKHYGVELKNGDWQRVDGMRARGRGGILGFAATLARQSGASRTSPILRGNWLCEVVLGDRLPRPPKGVPVLPEEAPQGLTERQLIERHSSDANCAGCHRRIDPFGFALEGFDAIGRARTVDAGGLPIDTAAKLPNGAPIDGIDGLRRYLVEQRRDDFLRQFCRKLLGYALGRSVQFSDRPLVDAMVARLNADTFKVGGAIELIVRSPQFREARGKDFVASN